MTKLMKTIYTASMTGCVLSFFLSVRIVDVTNNCNEIPQLTQIIVMAMMPTFLFIAVACWFIGSIKRNY